MSKEALKLATPEQSSAVQPAPVAKPAQQEPKFLAHKRLAQAIVDNWNKEKQT